MKTSTLSDARQVSLIDKIYELYDTIVGIENIENMPENCKRYILSELNRQLTLTKASLDFFSVNSDDEDENIEDSSVVSCALSRS